MQLQTVLCYSYTSSSLAYGPHSLTRAPFRMTAHTDRLLLFSSISWHRSISDHSQYSLATLILVFLLFFFHLISPEIFSESVLFFRVCWWLAPNPRRVCVAHLKAPPALSLWDTLRLAPQLGPMWVGWPYQRNSQLHWKSRTSPNGTEGACDKVGQLYLRHDFYNIVLEKT
jgi:hypothetical protein